MPDIHELADVFMKFIHTNATTILTVTAVAGVVGTALVTLDQAPKAKEIVEEIKEDKKVKRSIKEHVKRLIFTILPIVITAGFTIASILCLNHVHTQRYAAMSAAYALADRSLKEWQQHTKQVVGEEKTKEIKESIAESNSLTNVSDQKKEAELTGDPLYLIMDRVMGSSFYSSPIRIKEAFFELGVELTSCDWVNVNELYLKVNAVPVAEGQHKGWNNYLKAYEIGTTPMKIEYKLKPITTKGGMLAYELSYHPEDRDPASYDRLSV